jgi:thiamine kinase-like enzyme
MGDDRLGAKVALTAEEAITRVTPWHARGDIAVAPLPGGITNLNYKLSVGGQSFVLRIGGAETELLGIDRRCEHLAHRAAASLGIAPEIFFLIEPELYLVTRFIDGRPLSPAEIGRPDNLRRVAAAMRAYHLLTPIPCTFSPFRTVEAYAETSIRHGVELRADFADLMQQLRQIEGALLEAPASIRLCHNDLLNANFLDDGALRILDWEYAGMGDPFFDLGNFAVHHELSDEQDQILLESYFGAPQAPAQFAHLQLMKIASDFREAMWGMLQVGISQLDFDFRGYADRHFARMLTHLRDPRLESWLSLAAEQL